VPKYHRPSSLQKHCTRIVTLLYHTYTYDGNGMIGTLTRDMSTSIVGSGENVQSSEYVYDHMGRLMTGSIEFVGKVGNTYAVSTSYNKVGGLESKVSSPDASAQVFAGTSQAMTYDLTYQYSGTKPHQLTEVISSQGVPYAMSFAYNASGSISEITDLVGVDHSSYYWGQEQWLCGVENTQGIHHYVYDHAGERIMKSSITQTTVQLNDETINTVTTLEPYTLYVNPYYVVTSFSNADQRSKHYYMGTQRVATDIGVDYGVSPSPEQTESARGGNAMTVGETTQGLETDQVPFQSLGYKQDLERVLLGLSGEIGVEDLSEALVPIERFYPDLSAGVNSGEGIESEPPVYIGTRIMYWYHPDYVSNVDMVTDRSGEAYELFLYNAWGESLHHWSSSSTNSWSSPYRLNSKELDSETGMHYYGARYHHPKLSVWMSVDPLAHQTLEAYQFTGNNPIALIDPDGTALTEPERKKAIQRAKQYVEENTSPGPSSYSLGAKGEPGEQVDCSGLVSNTIVHAGLPDPVLSGTGRGVQRIMQASRSVTESEIVAGNVVIIDFGKNGGTGHIGIITEVNRDENGNLISFKFIHSSSSKGPQESTYNVGGSRYYDDDDLYTGYYAWDTEDTAPR
jgi:RHS repeat-associated protein